MILYSKHTRKPLPNNHAKHVAFYNPVRDSNLEKAYGTWPVNAPDWQNINILDICKIHKKNRKILSCFTFRIWQYIWRGSSDFNPSIQRTTTTKKQTSICIFLHFYTEYNIILFVGKSRQCVDFCDGQVLKSVEPSVFADFIHPCQQTYGIDVNSCLSIFMVVP